MITDNDRRIAEEATDKYLSRLADRPENEAYIRFALPNIILAAIAEAKKPLEEKLEIYRLGEISTIQNHLFGGFLPGGSPTPLYDALKKMHARAQEGKP